MSGPQLTSQDTIYIVRMVGCGLTYGAESLPNQTTVLNFLPTYRTFQISSLSSNTSYWVNMVCKDVEGGWHVSDTVDFTTGEKL